MIRLVGVTVLLLLVVRTAFAIAVPCTVVHVTPPPYNTTCINRTPSDCVALVPVNYTFHLPNGTRCYARFDDHCATAMEANTCYNGALELAKQRHHCTLYNNHTCRIRALDAKSASVAHIILSILFVLFCVFGVCCCVFCMYRSKCLDHNNPQQL